MIRLLGLSGSLRRDSFNTALLRAAQQEAGSGIEVEMATLHGIPLYDGDAEAASGEPAAVTALKDRIVACDGLMIFTPEYNGGIPGVAKNAIDWLSRPPADMARIFRGRPVAVLGATPGGFATTLSQAAWLPVLKHLGTEIWTGGRLGVSAAHTKIDANGQYDAETRKLVAAFVQGFSGWVKARRGS